MIKQIIKNPFRIAAFLMLGLLCYACEEPSTEIKEPEQAETKEVTEETSITVEAEAFNASSPEVTKEKEESIEYVLTPSENTWLAFDVDVKEAGRYKVEVNAAAVSGEVKVWLEDYIDNKDGRTYNITGSIPFTTNTFSTTQKDGTPLNKGVHKMKLHVEGGATKIDWVKFSLLKKHQLTPEVLTQKMDGKEWNLVWSDEFNGTGLPDSNKWTFDIGDWGWGNNELQYYTENRLENARQENGNLIIEARKNDDGNEWTSARLTTRGKVTFLYGKIEFKAKVPRNKGNWAAGWTLGDSYVDELSWPYCGEIDIMESVGYEVNDETGDGIAHCTVHTPAYYFKINNQISSVKNIPNIAGEFHTYAVEWTPTEVRGYVDGEQYYVYDKNANEKEWPFAQPQNIILNLAMGGGWGGAEGMDETMTSQELLVDYVHVYELK